MTSTVCAIAPVVKSKRNPTAIFILSLLDGTGPGIPRVGNVTSTMRRVHTQELVELLIADKVNGSWRQDSADLANSWKVVSETGFSTLQAATEWLFCCIVAEHRSPKEPLAGTFCSSASDVMLHLGNRTLPVTLGVSLVYSPLTKAKRESFANGKQLRTVPLVAANN